MCTLSRTIGPVTVLENFYEYQLCCRSLDISLKPFEKAVHDRLRALPPATSPAEHVLARHAHDAFEDRAPRTFPGVLTIDGADTTDRDDALGITTDARGRTVVSVYIADVAAWVDALDLWGAFTGRVATVYLPHQRRGMLPRKLAELCSLDVGDRRFATVMDVTYENNARADTDRRYVAHVSFGRCVFRVAENEVYGSPSLRQNATYAALCGVVGADPQTADSHDIVAHFMTLMNARCAEHLAPTRTGVYREEVDNGAANAATRPDLSKIVGEWRNTHFRYTAAAPPTNPNSNPYLHVTSPMRRLVDLLNAVHVHQIASDGAQTMCRAWESPAQIECLNARMRDIKKVQNSCALLDACERQPGILEEEYEGVCVEAEPHPRMPHHVKCTVYLSKLRLFARTVRGNDGVGVGDVAGFRLFLLQSPDTFARKVRVQCTSASC